MATNGIPKILLVLVFLMFQWYKLIRLLGTLLFRKSISKLTCKFNKQEISKVNSNLMREIRIRKVGLMVKAKQSSNQVSNMKANGIMV